MARKGLFGRNKNDDGQNYDVMNPEAEDPKLSAAKKESGKAARKALKAIRKAAVKVVKALVKLFTATLPWSLIPLIALIIAVVITAFNRMPGMMQSKLKDFFSIDTSKWFMNGAVSSLDENYEDIIGVANYLESMDYNLIGDGFVTPKLRNTSSILTSDEIIANHPEYTYQADSDGKYHFYDGNSIVSMQYYDNLGQTIDNTTGEVASGEEYEDEFGIIRSSTEFHEDTDGESRGKVSKVEEDDLKHYRLIRSYLLSDYRIYTLKNDDEKFLNSLADTFKSLKGNNDAWAKGLIKLYLASGGWATNHWWWGGDLGSNASIDGTTLSLKKGFFNNAMKFSIEGWAPRYGMSLDFLISLHLGTNAPDLVNAMLQNFDTEVQVYLDDSGNGNVEARYIDPAHTGESPSAGDSMDSIKSVIDENGDIFQRIGGAMINSSWLSFVNSLVLGKDQCQILLVSDKTTLTSPSNCTGADGKCSDQYTEETDADGNLTRKSTITECCDECQAYVKAALKALASVEDKNYETYTPYIARVVGSWFRDTYFIIPDNYYYSGLFGIKHYEAGIAEYSGGFADYVPEVQEYANENGTMQTETVSKSIAHPEVNMSNAYGENAKLVKVDQEYLGDSGEYWTSYVQKDDGSYQLYLLNGNGTTSDKTLEDFLDENGYSTQKEAEKDGWAFVKKSQTKTVAELLQDEVDDEGVVVDYAHTQGKEESDDRLNEHILWSAYSFDSNGSSSEWEKVKSGENETVDDLYGLIGSSDDGSGVFYQVNKTNNITQVEDAQRGETNALVKYLFKYRQFYIYDGGEERGVQIEHDKQRVLYGYDNYVSNQYDIEGKYYTDKVIADENDIKDCPSGITKENFYTQYEGLIEPDGTGKLINTYYNTSGDGWKSEVIDLLNKYGRSALRQSYSWATSFLTSSWVDSEDLAMQWLDWQLDMYYMDKYGVNLQAYYGGSSEAADLLKIDYDPRDPDLIGTVEITKSSLNVFSILENTGTIDADYAYRDFKELIVELNYFDRKELSTKNQEVFTWLLPEVDCAGWPNRPWDKQNTDYGTLLQSYSTYKALGVPDNTIASGGAAGSGFAGNVDASKLYWIGDSWTVGLVQEAKVLPGDVQGSGWQLWVNSERVVARIGESAGSGGSFFAEPNPPADTSGIIVALGKNGPFSDGIANTQALIDKLKSKYANIPVFVLKLTYNGTDPYNGAVSIKGTDIDNFNSQMQSYCSSKDGVFFVDPTGPINDTSSKTYKSTYGAGDNLHLNAEGYKVWYDAILSAVGGAGGTASGTTGATGSTSGTTGTSNTNSTTGTASTSTTATAGGSGTTGTSDTDSTSGTGTNGTNSTGTGNTGSTSGTGTAGNSAVAAGTFSVEGGSGDAEHIITANGIKYSQFDQSGKWGSVNVKTGDTQIRTDSGDTTLSGMGCGIYSSTSLMSAYVRDANPQKTCEWLHTNIGTSSFNNDGSRDTSITKMLTDNGISGSWTQIGESGAQQKLKEAFKAGKPAIINVKPGARVWTTGGGHYICFCGISSDGKVYTADSVSGGGSRLCHDYGGDFESAFSSMWSDISAGDSMTKFWIPDNAPTGVAIGAATSTGAGGGGTQQIAYFQGYKADQKVTSPVTGKILEIGKHERINVYTGEPEEVEFIKIKVMDSKDYFDKRVDDNKDYDYETSSSFDKASDALNLFYKEYEDVCAGYIITIDGFDVDLSTGDDESGGSSSSSSSTNSSNSTNTTSSNNTNNTTNSTNTTSSSTSSSGGRSHSDIPGNNGVYEQNEVHALYNSAQMDIRKDREQAKEDAPFFINCGESDSLPGDEYVCSDPDSIVGYYVKEGKFIGKTITSDEELISNEDAAADDANNTTTNTTNTTNPADPNSTNNNNTNSADPNSTNNNNTNPADPNSLNGNNTTDPADPNATNDNNTTDPTSKLEEKLTYTYKDFAEIDDFPADYMRIQIIDTDKAIVDDVERFWDIPEYIEGGAGGAAIGSVNQEYQAQPGDLEVLAEVILHESGGQSYLSQYNVHGQEEEKFNGYCMGYSVVNKLLEQNKAYYGVYYDSSRTDMSPLVQVVTNQKARWYGDPVPAEAMKVHNGGKGCYSDYELAIAEFCLKYDCTSVPKPFETEIGSGAAADGYTATPQGSPIPRAMCQQGGYGDGASGQSGIILVGYEDINKSGQFDVKDELFGVDRSMESLITNP